MHLHRFGHKVSRKHVLELVLLMVLLQAAPRCALQRFPRCASAPRTPNLEDLIPAICRHQNTKKLAFEAIFAHIRGQVSKWHSGGFLGHFLAWGRKCSKIGFWKLLGIIFWPCALLPLNNEVT